MPAYLSEDDSLAPHPLNETMKSVINYSIEGAMVLDDASVQVIDIAGSLITVGMINNVGTLAAKTEEDILNEAMNEGDRLSELLVPYLKYGEEQLNQNLYSLNNHFVNYGGQGIAY